MNNFIIVTRLLGLTFLLCSFLLNSNSIASDEFKVEVHGIRVIDIGYKNANENIMPFNQFSGTSISCLLLSQSEGIISFVEVKSILKDFKDNIGTNLIDPESNFGNGFGLMHEISKDKSALLFEISGNRLPDPKATSLLGSGEIVIKTANKSKIFEVQEQNIEKGVVIQTPFGVIEIKNIGKTTWGEYPYQISFESKSNLSVIKDVEFIDKTGSTIDSQPMGMSSLNETGNLSTLVFERSYSISEIPPKVKINFTYWDNMKTRVIPFSIDTSVGL